jgi:hypothetical protein
MEGLKATKIVLPSPYPEIEDRERWPQMADWPIAKQELFRKAFDSIGGIPQAADNASQPTSLRTRCWLNCWLTGSTVGGRQRTPTGGISLFRGHFCRSKFIRDEEVAGSNPVTPTM